MLAELEIWDQRQGTGGNAEKGDDRGLRGVWLFAWKGVEMEYRNLCITNFTAGK